MHQYEKGTDADDQWNVVFVEVVQPEGEGQLPVAAEDDELVMEI